MQIHIGIVLNQTELWEGFSFLNENKEKFQIIFCVNDIKSCMYFLDYRFQKIDILVWKFSKITSAEWFLLKIVKEKYLHLKVLLISDIFDYYVFAKVLDAGVDGFLISEFSLFVLESAIENINTGSIYIDSSIQHFFSKYKKEYIIRDTKLTTREKEIITCVASGMINKEIAYFLRIREETVKNHLSNIFRKFDVHDRTQAVIYAVKYHYIDL